MGPGLSDLDKTILRIGYARLKKQSACKHKKSDRNQTSCELCGLFLGSLFSDPAQPAPTFYFYEVLLAYFGWKAYSEDPNPGFMGRRIPYYEATASLSRAISRLQELGLVTGGSRQTALTEAGIAEADKLQPFLLPLPSRSPR